MKNFFLLILTFCILVSCKQKLQPLDESIAMEKCKSKAIENGNDLAYGTYLEYCTNHKLYLEKLSLSLIMNHKYSNLRSYYEVYANLIEIHNNYDYKAEYLNNLDSINKLYALHYLEEGARKSSIICQTTLEKVYRNKYGDIDIEKRKYDSLYSVLEKLPSLGRFYKVNKCNKVRIDKAIR